MLAPVQIDHPNNFPNTYHCTCVVINSIGIMIEGPSGAGKSSLAMGLIEAASQRRILYGFIGDDQILLENSGDELWASPPPSIAGKIEIHGYGISDLSNLENGKIGLVCMMIDQCRIDRHPESTACSRLGVNIASVYVPIQHEAQSIRIIFSKLNLQLW